LAHREQQSFRSREEIGGPDGPETYVLTSPSASTTDGGDRKEMLSNAWSDGNVPGHDHNLRPADWHFLAQIANGEGV
jgi:hypothetical protein